ncbi:autophagy-related protein 16 [Apiospora saccharicola]|uniref:Autophagy-related protein 16 n=1 Tax=Apiospora saccharicola TaxID=335842 RepID=A0ABR1WD85_9PEZI
MPDWRDEYLVNIQEAERANPVNRDLVAACSQLADRIASLEAEKTLLAQKLASSSGPSTSQSPNPSSDTAPGATTTTTTTTTDLSSAATPQSGSGSGSGSGGPGTAELKRDLAEALRSKGQLEAKLKTSTAELQKLRTKTKADDKRLHDLTAERNTLATKLKDRNEELVGKTKLLKEVQDDNLTLNMEINMTEQKAARVAAENKELVDRWMKRMAQEADAMNLSNEPRHRSGR